MYLILVYDINSSRVRKVHKFLKKRLHWVQNSVFEGNLTKSQRYKMNEGLKEIINPSEDSIIIYNLYSKKWSEREVIGRERQKTDNLI